MFLKPFAAGRNPRKNLEVGHLQQCHPISSFALLLGVFLCKLCHFQCEFHGQVCSYHLYQLEKTDDARTVIQIPPTYMCEASGIAIYPHLEQCSDGSLRVLDRSQYHFEVSIIFRDTEVFRSVQKVWVSRSVGS